VLDHQHRAIGRDAADQGVMRSTSLVRHSAVGSSSSIISGSSASVVAISSARLRPYGSSTAVRSRELGEAHGVDELDRARVERRQQSGGLQKSNEWPALALERDADVLEHGQVREHRRDLERADESHARDRRRPRARDLAAVEEDLPRVGTRKCVSRLKQVVLPAPLGRSARGWCRGGRHADVAHRDEALELLGEPARLENDVVGHPLLCARSSA
jgi:hypothetical protein